MDVSGILADRRQAAAGRRSEGQVDERSRVLTLVLWTPLDERRAQVDQLLERQRRGDVPRTFSGGWDTRRAAYLSAGAGLVAGSDQVGGVGQVDE